MKDRQIALVVGALVLIAVIIGILLYVASDQGQEQLPPPKPERFAQKPQKAPETPAAPIPEEAPKVETPEQVEPIAEVPMPAPIASGKCKGESRADAQKRAQAAPKGMVYVPGGAFTMGSSANTGNEDESPAREVCLSGFYIDKYEVTNEQFKQFVDATGYVTEMEKDPATALGRSWRHPFGDQSSADDMPDYPVVCVSWLDANNYARWAGKRLPTEAEWEKAARGTGARAYPWGNQPPTSDLANVADKSAGLRWSDSSVDDKHQRTAPVGSFPAGKSDYGAFDMAGNVWEWCFDWWAEDSYAVGSTQNPTGPKSGDFRVIRGGSWFDFPEGAKSAYRMYFLPDGASADIGFRCVKDVG